MRPILTAMLLGSCALLVACNTVEGAGQDISSVGEALDPNRDYPPCGTYGSLDTNNDGYVSTSEWNAYRAGAYPGWDLNRDGRVSQREFNTCWYGGGFYPRYNRTDWMNNWRAFDANGDGFLSSDEYWSAAAWARLNRNGDGRIDANEWTWAP